jgi:hypothetical protein
MPRVSQNLYGSPKRRLQPILILDEPLVAKGLSASGCQSALAESPPCMAWAATSDHCRPSGRHGRTGGHVPACSCRKPG